MKVATIFGTRPEIIRLSQVIKRLDEHCDQTLIHTGQNYDPQLSDIFFGELQLRPPDQYLGIRATVFHEQVSQILARCGDALRALNPDRVLILGDTNSGLAAIIAARMGIPVYHMEAGNRCYDDRVPEEINRRIIDHSSTILMPYTHRSKENLLREGLERDRIYVIGNPIFEVLQNYDEKISQSKIHSRLELESNNYFLCTMHRAESVDVANKLRELVQGLDLVAERFNIPVIVSLHPRTAEKIEKHGLSTSNSIKFVEPLGLFDFVALERNAKVVITDSGTVQEECSIFRIPNVTIRDVTERAETIEVGSNILAGTNPDSMYLAVKMAVTLASDWSAPPEYLVENVSNTVVKIILGYLGPVGRVRHQGDF